MSDLLSQLRLALPDRYELERLLGSGGMATVYLARDLKHHRMVAVKVLRPELANAIGPDRFQREILTVASLTHPHILPLHDSGESDGFLYYVMPFVEGESLRDRLSRETQLPLDDALQITGEVADALGYAHSHGIVHRDIKPENILLEAGHAVVADFGIARVMTTPDVETFTSPGAAIGTLLYMSPEQASGSRSLDGRSDQYALGAVLYEMLAGDPPYSASSAQALIARKLNDPLPRISVVRESVPPHVEAAIVRATQRVAADRYRTMGEFAAALKKSPSAEERAAVPEIQHPERRRRAVRLGVGALFVIGLVVLGWKAISSVIGAMTRTRYTNTPTWSAWRAWTGEFFPLFAVSDSMLLTAPMDSKTAQIWNGQHWSTFAIPDSFVLLPHVGNIANGRLVAARTVAGPAGNPLLQYWWVSVSSAGLRPLSPIAGSLPNSTARPSWWSDGQDVALFVQDAIRRPAGNAWVREPTGTNSSFASLWGSDVRHRFAITTAGDSLLVYDGINWKSVDLLGPRAAGRPTYLAGATFRDGATVVIGAECTASDRCRPLLVEQESFAGRWRQVPIPDHFGIPVDFAAAPEGQCDPGRFSFADIGGRTRGDYFVWGSWDTCDAGSARIDTGCPPGQPCFWHVSDGRFEPVADLLGKMVQTVAYMDTSAYALLNDGTLWLQIGDHWRKVTQVPVLPLRMVGTSPRVIVRLTGGDFRYEPGASDTMSRVRVARLDGVPSSISEATPPRRLVVKDSTIALLAADGTVFVSQCRIERGGPLKTGRPGGSLKCSGLTQLPVQPGRITAIDVFADGRVIGVGPRGLVITWRGEVAETGILPLAAREDSLWGVVTSPSGGATAVGKSTVVQSDARGRWTLVRRLWAGGPHLRFQTLPDGDLVVMERSVQVWDRSNDSLPVAVIYRPDRDQVGALHALADGRLIAGLANPEDLLLGGGLVVWATPARANHFQKVSLPISVDITDLADDGRYLYVVGRGGSLRIPLDSLPFAKPPPRI